MTWSKARKGSKSFDLWGQITVLSRLAPQRVAAPGSLVRSVYLEPHPRDTESESDVNQMPK